MTVLSQAIRKANKNHTCDGCFQMISKGNRYYSSVWTDDDDIDNTKLCAKCYYVWHNDLYDEDCWDEGFRPGELEDYHNQVPEGYQLPERL